jgi:hypothetical protein
MQGLVAYYYDFVNKDNAVELNQCRHNHMGMDVLYRHEPNYSPGRVKKEFLGGCRNTLKYCEGRLYLVLLGCDGRMMRWLSFCCPSSFYCH